ncbi:DUF6795 domain-containing protein [uncultured Lamprocystis sp.]|jgi:uncharacterized GH25 family protein|uniref:DUF6795 domain-containing protein n=1 Tax=uncultured Lamprocystis sp. TaxID=543132 RepID=UPI00345BC4C3
MAKTLTLFSAIRGTVMQDGKPVSGAEVERSYRWHWKDQVSVSSSNQGKLRDAVSHCWRTKSHGN